MEITHKDTKKYCSLKNNNIDNILNECCFTDQQQNIHDVCDKCMHDFVKNTKIDKKNIYASYFLGYYYHNISQINQKNKNELVHKYYKYAIDNNHVNAMYQLGKYYETQSYQVAIDYFLMAHENKHKGAMCSLGHLYKRIGDIDEMLKCYSIAISNDDPNAMFELGRHYLSIKNYDEMKKYYNLAISKNHGIAYVGLAAYYQYIEKDYELAKKIYLECIDSGHLHGYFEMAELYASLNNYYQAEKYFLESYKKGRTYSLVRLFNVAIDHEKYDLALKWFVTLLNNDAYSKYMFDSLINHLNPIKIYFMCDKNNDLKKFFDPTQLVQIIEFIKNMSIQICQLCFVERECYSQNDCIVCWNCL